MTSKIKVDNIADQDDNNIINESGDVITVGAAGDTVAVAGNIVKSNAYQASDGGSIISQSGTTITIGASGDTVSLASGASQSGFGRSGSVDWQTGSIKTATFTAASGEGYFCNTSGGAFTMNLPAGSAGAIVAVSDYTRTFNSNNLTITPNGSEKIGGIADNLTLSVNGQALTLVYVDATEGWINVQNAEDTETGSAFLTATGGTITTSGNFKIHTFTGPGTFAVSALSSTPANNAVDYMVIAGGGSGGNGGGPSGGSGGGSGGGGAGGYRESPGTATCYTASPLGASPATAITVTAANFPITVGAGGAVNGSSPSNGAQGNSGNNSVFSTITSTAGGGGGGWQPTPGSNGLSGGSGGGAGCNASGASPGNGNTPPVSPPQGNNGGAGTAPNGSGGGGGGAGGAGQQGVAAVSSPQNAVGGAGGAGTTSSINGTPTARAGGGGGGTGGDLPDGPAGAPGPASAGGGAGGVLGATGTAGTANTGGGGGAGGANPGKIGGAGGSGIVVIRYKFQ